MRLRIQAESKVSEAKYYLNSMKQNYDNDKIFSYNLSAFLSAARNITWYLQRQFSSYEGFSEWYSEIREIMRNDEELKYINESRNQEVSEKSTPYKLRNVIDALFSPSIKDTHKNNDKKPSYNYQLNSSNKHKTGSKSLSKMKNREIIDFYEKQLIKLEKIVDEWKRIISQNNL